MNNNERTTRGIANKGLRGLRNSSPASMPVYLDR